MHEKEFTWRGLRFVWNGPYWVATCSCALGVLTHPRTRPTKEEALDEVLREAREVIAQTSHLLMQVSP